MDSTEKLALMVLKTALKDAVKDTSKIKDTVRRKQLDEIKQEAIEFLTVHNEDFRMWCRLTSIPLSTISREVEKVKTNPKYLRLMLKQLENIII